MGDGDGVLDVGGAAAVGAADGPAVGVDLVLVRSPGQEPGLDRDDQSREEPEPVPGTAGVGDVRVLVHVVADAVAAEVGGDAVAGGPADGADRRGDVADPAARDGGGDARSQCLSCGSDQAGPRWPGRSASRSRKSSLTARARRRANP